MVRPLADFLMLLITRPKPRDQLSFAINKNKRRKRERERQIDWPMTCMVFSKSGGQTPLTLMSSFHHLSCFSNRTQPRPKKTTIQILSHFTHPIYLHNVAPLKRHSRMQLSYHFVLGMTSRDSVAEFFFFPSFSCRKWSSIASKRTVLCEKGRGGKSPRFSFGLISFLRNANNVDHCVFGRSQGPDNCFHAVLINFCSVSLNSPFMWHGMIDM